MSSTKYAAVRKAKQGHLEFLAEEGLKPIGKLGREEMFTGALAAALLNTTTQPFVLDGLRLPQHPVEDLFVAVQPIDLLITAYDPEDADAGLHVYLVEVKWLGTNSNYPGWTRYPSGMPKHDYAPSQLDRAHRLVREKVAPAQACSCGYPQPCSEHGCPRCRGPKAARPWHKRKWPDIYPTRPGHDLQKALAGLPALRPGSVHCRLLDYRDRAATDAFDGGLCNDAWLPAPMSQLAKALQDAYGAATGTGSDDRAVRASLGPLLQMIYAD